MNLGQPPAPNQLEITIFGPGIGESILVHVGSGRWICVDSAKFSRTAWPLYYLDSIGVRPDRFSLIVATHWHSDHVDGISDVIAAAPKALFACSQALRTDEFKNLLARYVDVDQEPIRAPLKEIRTAFELHWARKETDRNAPVPVLAGPNQRILQEPTGGGFVAEVWSLSPSSDDILNSMREFATLFTPPEKPAPGIPPAKQNTTSVVLRVTVGPDVILLGADLEQTSRQTTGWNAVVGNWGHGEPQAGMYKIAHHGSEGAFSDDLWSQKICPDAVAVVTPYTSSGLPRYDQIVRLNKLGRKIYATGLPEAAQVERSVAVNRVIRARARSLHSMPAERFGVVRLRKTIGAVGSWDVELIGSALQL